jgi:hypothetical protein
MEASKESSLPPQLQSLAKKLHRRSLIDCKKAIKALSPEDQFALLDHLVEFVKIGITGDNDNNQLLLNCIRYFFNQQVYELLKKVKTCELLLRQFCSFFYGNPDFFCLIRISKILLEKSEDDFLKQILMILNEKRYMGVRIAIQTLHFLAKEMTSPLATDITVDLREKILNFLWPMGEKTVRVIIEMRQTEPTEPFDLDDWIITTRKIIAQL